MKRLRLDAIVTLLVILNGCGEASNILPSPAADRLDWTEISMATTVGNCGDPYDPPPDYETECEEYQPPPPPEYDEEGQMFQGEQVNPYGCQGLTEYPHYSTGGVSLHARSWCSVNVPQLRAQTALQFWTWVFWNTHDTEDVTLMNKKLNNINTRSECANGKWRGISFHSALGPDSNLYVLGTEAKNEITEC